MCCLLQEILATSYMKLSGATVIGQYMITFPSKIILITDKGLVFSINRLNFCPPDYIRKIHEYYVNVPSVMHDSDSGIGIDSGIHC